MKVELFRGEWLPSCSKDSLGSEEQGFQIDKMGEPFVDLLMKFLHKFRTPLVHNLLGQSWYLHGRGLVDTLQSWWLSIFILIHVFIYEIRPKEKEESIK